MHSTARRHRGQEPPVGHARPGAPVPWTLSPARRDSDRVAAVLLDAPDPGARPGDRGQTAVGDGMSRLARRVWAAIVAAVAVTVVGPGTTVFGPGGSVAAVAMGASVRGSRPPGRPDPRVSTLGQVGEHLPEGSRAAA